MISTVRSYNHSFDYVIKKLFEYAACNAMEHQVLRQDTGEISPGNGREGWGREEERF